MFGPFTLDPCASKENHKCVTYFTREEDGLSKSWRAYRSFINPPYGRVLGRWVEKAYNETRHPMTSAVMLIPARTDTSYFHKYIMKADRLCFVRGRIRFGDGKNSAPFPSMLVFFDGESCDLCGVPKILPAITANEVR